MRVYSLAPGTLVALSFLGVLIGTVRAQSAASSVRTVDRVDLDRYVGDWYEIARFPNGFQRRCTGDVMASYTRRPDGRIDVVNRCQTAGGPIAARGLARIVDPRSFAKLEVRFAPAFLSFLPAVWGDYWIIGLAEDYSWAVVGSPDRKYLWVLARSPEMSAETLARATAIVRRNGFDARRLEKTTQSRREPEGVR